MTKGLAFLEVSEEELREVVYEEYNESYYIQYRHIHRPYIYTYIHTTYIQYILRIHNT